MHCIWQWEWLGAAFVVRKRNQMNERPWNLIRISAIRVNNWKEKGRLNAHFSRFHEEFMQTQSQRRSSLGRRHHHWNVKAENDRIWTLFHEEDLSFCRERKKVFITRKAFLRRFFSFLPTRVSKTEPSFWQKNAIRYRLSFYDYTL